MCELNYPETYNKEVREMVKENETSANIATFIVENARDEQDLKFLISVALTAAGRSV